MDEIISDPTITSYLEIQEKAEKAAFDAAAQRMRDIVRLAFEENDAIVREKNGLQEQLTNELRFMASYEKQLIGLQDSAEDQLSESLQIETQLMNINLETLNILSSLQELRKQHLLALQADPITLQDLLQEERRLQQQLEERGIIVHPATGSDEYLH